MKKVLILFPRLDCSFKKGHVPEKVGPPNHPLRHHFNTFLERLVQRHLDKGDQVVIDERALWQFDPSRYKNQGWDIIYVPHKQKYQFDVGWAGRYYMQQVIPTIFSISETGWGADYTPSITPTRNKKTPAFDKLRERIASNDSKFSQPIIDKTFKERDYIFFPCQLPHDETIKYHSEISVYSALEDTIKNAKMLGKKVIVKGHPANPGSMSDLRNLCIQHSKNDEVRWVDNLSIHQLIDQCAFVSLVNSGVGIESLLHEKIVIAYGNADYTKANNPMVLRGGQVGFLNAKYFLSLIKDERIYTDFLFKQNRNFIQAWYDAYFDVEDEETFNKI